MPNHPTKLLDRSRAREVGHETLAILRRGSYLDPSGRTVEIADAVARARAGTVAYPPDRAAPRSEATAFSTSIEVRNETTLEAVHRLVLADQRPVALNFASATHSGGAWLNGARAQEESLVRSSGLYACLEGSPMYDFHRERRDRLYTDWVVYSPDVPVFREDDGRLLEEPYACSFLTSPAPNRSRIAVDDAPRLAAIGPTFRSRIARVLAVGRAHGHETIVLGAWGCGAFGNDPKLVARLFGDALGGAFRGAYREVLFAIYDAWEDRRTIGPFLEQFGG